jgi:hypothetical protein
MRTWICDFCGGPINKPEDGLVEWVDFEESKPGRSLRLVHNSKYVTGSRKDSCTLNDAELVSDKESVGSNSLADYIGDNGLMHLLTLISESTLSTHDVLEMIKRLHITGYEQARKHFKEAINAGVFEPNTKKNFYSQSDIEATINFISKK